MLHGLSRTLKVGSQNLQPGMKAREGSRKLGYRGKVAILQSGPDEGLIDCWIHSVSGGLDWEQVLKLRWKYSESVSTSF